MVFLPRRRACCELALSDVGTPLGKWKGSHGSDADERAFESDGSDAARVDEALQAAINRRTVGVG
jgi:hypothetical protein